MQVFNVEVFDRSFNLIFADQVDAIEYEEDYIVLTKNTIFTMYSDAVEPGQFIHLTNNIENYFGVVSYIECDDLNQMEIGYLPFYSIFNTKILFDTNLQGSGQSLETVIGGFISSYFKTNTDTEQNIPTLGAINYSSSTTSWGFNLKSDAEGMHMCIVDLYDTILVRAFKKYGIVVTVEPDLTNKVVNLTIGKINDAQVTIESGYRNVLDTDILVGQMVSDYNKLIVYNETDYTESRTYYLHTDGTYSTTNTDRITPVVEVIKSTEPDGTFASAADSVAADVFGGIEFKNNITVELLKNSAQINPLSVKIGQKVRIINEGVYYSSILSKRTITDTVTLTFGSIRIEYTALLKGGLLNG